MSALADLLGPTKPTIGAKRPAPNYGELAASTERQLAEALELWKNADTRDDIISTVNNLRSIIKVREDIRGNAPAALSVTIEKDIENLAYLCIQENLREEADELLLELRYTHSLSDKVVRYKDTSIKNGT